MKNLQLGIRRWYPTGAPLHLDVTEADLSTTRSLIEQFWGKDSLREFSHEIMFVSEGGPLHTDWVWEQTRNGSYGTEMIHVKWPARYKPQEVQ